MALKFPSFKLVIVAPKLLHLAAVCSKTRPACLKALPKRRHTI